MGRAGRILPLAKMNRINLLAAVLAAFNGIKGNMSEAEWEQGVAIVENEFDCDLDAVALYLRSELAACELVCKLSEKE